MKVVNEQGLVEAHFHSKDEVRVWIEREMPTLPPDLKPSHFGFAEREQKRPTNQITERERFQHFLDSHSGGFLYGDGFSFQFDRNSNVPSEITLWIGAGDFRIQEYGVAIVEGFARCDAVRSFACEWAEYAARNQFTIKYVDRGSCQGFIGRDFRRYVPGLYWLNYFSNEYIAKMEINLESLASRLCATIVPLAQGAILRLYEKPCDWRTGQGDVEDVIHQTKNFFSMRNVHIPANLSQRNPEHFSWSPSREWP